jgi:hypothetical protein
MKKFRFHGLDLSDASLVDRYGLPGDIYPSDNRYAFLTRYFHDFTEDIPMIGEKSPGQGVHPAVLQMLRANYNIKNRAQSADDITVSSSRIRNPFSMLLFQERTKHMRQKHISGDSGPTTIMNTMGFSEEDFAGKKRFRIRTFDEETSGLR